MIEILSPLIANGSTVGTLHYQPWLPFYNFGVFIGMTLLIATIAKLCDSERLFSFSMSVFSCSLLSLISSYMLWTIWLIEPYMLFLYWVSSTIILSIMVYRHKTFAIKRENHDIMEEIS